jgi:hypothetical protein
MLRHPVGPGHCQFPPAGHPRQPGADPIRSSVWGWKPAPLLRVDATPVILPGAHLSKTEKLTQPMSRIWQMIQAGSH